MSGNRLMRIPRSLFGLQAVKCHPGSERTLGRPGPGLGVSASARALNLADNRLGALGDVHKAPVLRTWTWKQLSEERPARVRIACDCLRS